MSSKFPLFRSHLEFCHHFWSQLPLQDQVVIDATAGNGHDSLILAKLTLQTEEGALYTIDIQQEALDKTKRRLEEHLLPDQLKQVIFCHCSHEQLPTLKKAPLLIVYNLGYLPGGNKALTTQTRSTLTSLANAAEILAVGGVISITCYPGHTEGLVEEQAVLTWVKILPKDAFSVTHTTWLNREDAPSVILIQKNQR